MVDTSLIPDVWWPVLCHVPSTTFSILLDYNGLPGLRIYSQLLHLRRVTIRLGFVHRRIIGVSLKQFVSKQFVSKDLWWDSD